MNNATDRGDPMMANAELRALFDAAVDAIVVIDEVGRILTFNRAAELVFGHDAEEMIGQPVELLMPEPHRTLHAQYMRRYLDTGQARIIGIGREVEAVKADGTIFPIALSVGEAKSGDRRRFVAIIRDLSHQREAEQHARSLEMRLAQVDRFNLMGEMAAGIAHEINQPLSAIATYAQTGRRFLDREPGNTDALLEICEKIDAQARRAGQVIENVRKFIRRQEVSTELLDVNRVVAGVRDLIEVDAHAAGIPITFRYGDELPKVRGDAVQLQQVVLNLTRNAVDAMRGGSEVHRGIAVETLRTASGVRVSVTDHGPGVARSVGNDIFDPFVTTKSSGLGVGLAISRTIAQALGGKLEYGDNPEGGAVFSLELPAADG